ncbi:MAG: hypothetical protein MJK15_17510 [Colwellia sp.]|nr:hypothetical protein [Colwellia sp.]
MSLETFGFGDQFTLQEAFELLNSHVVKKEDEDNENLAIDQIGFIAGVLTLNDEVEVMIKFPKELIQLTKAAFSEQMSLLEMS